VEGFKYPVYAVQWLPEKAPLEWQKLHAISHAPTARKTSTLLCRLFSCWSSGRQSPLWEHTGGDWTLTYQFCLVYTADISSFQQSFFLNIYLLCVNTL
jgi:gamma-glutamyl hydrolase